MVEVTSSSLLKVGLLVSGQPDRVMFGTAQVTYPPEGERAPPPEPVLMAIRLGPHDESLA